MRRLASFFIFACACSMATSQVVFDTYPVDETDKTPKHELAERRKIIKETLGSNSVAVFFTNAVHNRNNDVDFQFRGDSNFIYLTGFEEPDSALILAPDGITIDGTKTTEVLFLSEPNMMSLTWLGYLMGSKNAVRLLGIETALPNNRFTEILKLAIKPGIKLSGGWVPPGATDTLERMAKAFETVKKEAAPERGVNIYSKLADMRAVKSPYEIEIMKKVCDITARAHVEAMKAIKPGMREYEIEALVEYHYARQGCEFYGYPSICGSGPNSTILHYQSNRRLMKDGDIYCMDSAGEYHNYTADVTRSFPVNGKFTKEQREIYEVVYAAQEAGINACKPGASYSEISNLISNKLAEGLLKLGIIKDKKDLGKYYMHGFGHGLGLDVHDPLPMTLGENMCLTVEPGIYIKAGSPCPEKYWNIGIRIEDDILVTKDGPVNLSKAAPRTWQEIEKVMASK